MIAAISGLVGVTLGFGLTIGYEQWKIWKRRKELKASLLEELRTNLHVIPKKRDILQQTQQTIIHFNEGKLLPPSSVHFIRVFYNTYFPSVLTDLSIKERNSLHVLYEYFRIVDWFTESCTDRIVEAVGTRKVSDYVVIYKSMMEDILNVLDQAEKLITKHLEGHPEDVFYLEKHK